MKTKLIGIFAVVIAVGMSFLTAPKTFAKPQTSYSWYQVADGLSLGAAVPNSQATYKGTGTTAPTEPGCSTSKSDQCVSGFTSSQVNPTTHQLIDDSQTPAVQPYTQN